MDQLCAADQEQMSNTPAQAQAQHNIANESSHGVLVTGSGDGSVREEDVPPPKTNVTDVTLGQVHRPWQL
jgi:hypothetical protein